MNKRTVIVALALSISLPGCGAIEIKNPFAGLRASPLETALASSKAAIEGAAEWYTDACVMRFNGIAIDEDLCRTFYVEVGPALVGAQNTAVRVAKVVDADAGGFAIARATVRGAQRLFVDFAARYGLSREPWSLGVTLAFSAVDRRLAAEEAK